MVITVGTPLFTQEKPKKEMNIMIFPDINSHGIKRKMILYQFVKRSPVDTRPFEIIFFGKKTPIKGPQKVKILTYANFGFEGDILAFEVQTKNKKKGWLDPAHTWAPVKVVNVDKNDVLNIRSGESAQTKIVDTVKPGKTLYVNWDDQYRKVNRRGIDGQWLRVYTLKGVFGYAKINYLKETTDTPDY